MFFALGLCLLLWGKNVRAAEPVQEEEIGVGAFTVEEREHETVLDTRTKTVRLPAGEVTRIPRYEDEGDVLYVLDEDSIRIRVTGTDKAEGADVLTVTRRLTELPDNDLERIPMTISHTGNTCELLYVVYEETDWDEYELPVEYEALCCYGWLEKYEVSYDTEWEATMTYIGYPVGSRLTSTAVRYFYEGEGFLEQMEMQEEETIVAQVEQREGQMERRMKAGGKEEDKTPLEGSDAMNRSRILMAGIVLAAVLGGGLFGLWGFFYCLTAPIYVVSRVGIEKRLGRVWLKRRVGGFTAVLTKALMDKAERPSFMIRISGYLKKHTEDGLLEIQCPSGASFTEPLEREVLFRVPIEEW